MFFHRAPREQLGPIAQECFRYALAFFLETNGLSMFDVTTGSLEAEAVWLSAAHPFAWYCLEQQATCTGFNTL